MNVTILRRITRGCSPYICALALILAALSAACGSDAPTPGTAAAPATEGSVATDREALVAFYNAMDGDNWTNNANWLSEAPLAEWHGVHTNSKGRVFNVRLTDNQLSGELPSELGNLTYLIILGTMDNQVSGEIPVELASLAYLASLELHGNQLSGEIPPELGSLSSLGSLRLEDNQFSGEIPPELGSLSNLEWLALDFNQLTGEIPSELGSLSNLEFLQLGYNQLTGEIPSELGRLSNLKRMELGGNDLSGEIPSELGRLSNLELLHLDGNQLTGCIPGGLRGVQYSDVDRIGLPFCGETATDPTDTSAATPTPEWDSTVTFTVVHNVSPKTHVLEIPVEKCTGLTFDLTATEVVYLSHTSPDGKSGDWGNYLTLSYFTDWREAGGIYQLEVRRKYGETTPSEVTVSYRVEPLPANYQCDPADQ